MCRQCEINPVWEFTNKRKLCKTCFAKYFRRKINYTIRKFCLIEKGDKVGVAVSGGKDSMATLFVLNDFCKKNRSELIALFIDEGIKCSGKNYRDKGKKYIEKFCKDNNIEFIETSFEKEYKLTLNKKLSQIKKIKISNCFVCSILKRALLNKIARSKGITKLATGHSLDDEAETIILNLVKGDIKLLAKLGPIAGVLHNRKFAARIKPLYLCTTKEIVLFARLMNIKYDSKICPIRSDTLRIKIRKFLSGLEKQHPEVKRAIVNSYLKIMPLLKLKFKDRKINYCEICSEPTSTGKCKTCWVLKKLE